MQSKNKKSMTVAEGAYVARVANLSCGVCDAPAPSEVHEVEQGMWFTSMPLCADCHRGAFNGIHGQGRLWKVQKQTELSVLNDTIRRLSK